MRGPIPFSRYMELCLYHPELGYYSRNAEQFGKAGDFYTSSDVHAVFGRLLARQFEEIWRVMGSPAQIEILELGPGRGLFAQDVLDWSEKKFPDFFAGAALFAIGTVAGATSQAWRDAGKVPGEWPGFRAVTGRPGKKRGGAEKGVAGKDVTGTDVSGKDVTGKDVTGKDGKGTTSVVPGTTPVERALAPEVPLLIFANEFFDALPVEIVSDAGMRFGYPLRTIASSKPGFLHHRKRWSFLTATASIQSRESESRFHCLPINVCPVWLHQCGQE